LGEFLVEEANHMGLKGVHVKGVTVHPYTQKFSQKLGYKDCGFLLAHSPKTLSFKGIADELSQRNSDVVGFKYLQKPELKDLYLPEHHSEMILKLFANLDTPVKMVAPTNSLPLNNQTVMNVSINSMRSLGEIRILQYGKDIIMSLRRELHRLRKEEVHVIEMFLSLSDPMTPVFVPEIEKLGFFFTGIMPETAGGDSMILQYLNGVQIEYEELTIVSDMANELLTYIQENDPYYT
jgi:serine/threonine-protein kinase RsbW